ncbi:DASH complex subunit DAD4 [Pleurotus pulmonarius]
MIESRVSFDATFVTSRVCDNFEITTMENPHAERQAVLLERILKNSSKCTEMILELNHCLEEVLRANSAVQTAADLSTKYRKNVQYNMEVTKENALR